MPDDLVGCGHIGPDRRRCLAALRERAHREGCAVAEAIAVGGKQANGEKQGHGSPLRVAGVERGLVSLIQPNARPEWQRSSLRSVVGSLPRPDVPQNN